MRRKKIRLPEAVRKICVCGRKTSLEAAGQTGAEEAAPAKTGAAEGTETAEKKTAEGKTAEKGAAEHEAGKAAEVSAVPLLDELVRRACESQASDIHIEPFEDHAGIRMRLDGALVKIDTLQRSAYLPLIARLKILCEMDIAEHRIPQDGHFRRMVEGEAVNMRVSILPTVFGEKAVIRLLSGNGAIDYAESFGMRPEDSEKLRRMLRSPSGMIYLTGPTGSGKTTTLYLILAELADGTVNISTIEDPVEKNLPDINQCQVNPQAGMTFEKGLRAILRQDPDIIMVGETRDKETAVISARAAITGHLVLSTLHTNDAVSAVVRLEDMGLEPYMAASALNGVVAQRLVRKLCPECAQTVPATEADQKFLGRKLEKIRVPGGCPACSGTGYRGRTAIHEILVVDKTIRRMIADRADLEEIREYARREQGMRTLRECGSELAAEGITSMEELKKAAYYEE
ncbi:MAG: GspE/PulE family protein [Lachnospiraceae bacterium]|nr:GspE/PulE family protein [Lachnospiraceae bacterium]